MAAEAGLPRREVYARALSARRERGGERRRGRPRRGGAPTCSACAPSWSPPLLLRLKGYQVLARRFVAAGGEIDLVARRGATIAFVEVKARDDLDAAAAAITPTKRAPHRPRGARLAGAQPLGAQACTLRGDAVFIAPRAASPPPRRAYRLDID